ncbi:MAG: transcription termination/antitermination protein NusA [Hyphomonadaceae bacterium]|nr:transcription termination/antitermination protein NusA [Clostridia bacterium]
MAYILDLDAFDQLTKEKNLKKDYLLESIQIALVKAYQKDIGVNVSNIEVTIDHSNGETKVIAKKKVVDDVLDPLTEIELQAALSISKRYELGDMVSVDVTPKTFGRIAAQTAKNVVVQRIREAERDKVFDEYTDKQNEMVVGVIQQRENGGITIKVNGVEATMPESEQISGEKYEFGKMMKLYVLDVKKTGKAARVVLSRSHPGLVKRLFEQEVPEIHDGIVEIKSISREAGSRTKIAVHSVDSNVDAIGACVGQKGGRVQVVSDELGGEKIDIIKWHQEITAYIAESLSPAKVISVSVIEQEKAAKVIVPDAQLSLAIGKEGQNARLAARLTGWKIDIKSQSQVNG